MTDETSDQNLIKTNVVKFPKFNSPDVLESLKKLTSDVQEDPDIAGVVIVVGRRKDGRIWIKCFGEDINRSEGCGILDYGKDALRGVKYE